MEANREWRITVEPDDGAGGVTVAPAGDGGLRIGKRHLHRGQQPALGGGHGLGAAGRVFGDRGDPLDRALRGRVGDAFSFELRFSESFAVSYPAGA